jgi:hypothetical protein
VKSEDLTVAGLLDLLCLPLLDARYRNKTPRLIRIHASLFDTVAEAKQQEVRRGLPISLFGVETVGADDVRPDQPEIICWS